MREYSPGTFVGLREYISISMMISWVLFRARRGQIIMILLIAGEALRRGN